MWTTQNRPRYDRDKLRYPSDLTNEEWSLVEPVIPPAKHGGRKREVEVREVVNGIMYVLSTGCQWRYIPKDLPPKSTVHDYLTRWNYDGTIEKIHDALYMQCREAIGREASPTACVIDSQSVKSAEKGGPASIHPAMTRAKDQGQEAPYSGRHGRSTTACRGASSGHSGPRRRRAGPVYPVRDVSLPAEAVRRRRISGAAVLLCCRTGAAAPYS